MSTKRGTGFRVVAGAALIVIAITTAGYFAFAGLFSERAAAPAPGQGPVVAPEDGPPGPGAQRQEAVVLSVEGKVEKTIGNGGWTAVVAGDHLGAEDSLRTANTGRAELAIGDKSRLTVTASTELKVRELTRAVHQVRLTRGRLVASYGADGERVLRIEDENGTAVAETKAAKFSVLANGQALAVATETGSVNLEAAGKTVTIDAGQEAFAQSGEAPSAATTISAEVLLKIARAHPTTDPSLCAVIEGNVTPGSALDVDGNPVPTDVHGRFKAQVARRAGQTSAHVAVRDASGRTRESVVACRAEAAAPPVELEMTWKQEGDAG